MTTRIHPPIDVAELYDPTRDECFAFQQAPDRVRRDMNWEGTVSQAIQALCQDPDRVVTRDFWMPTRVLRAVMDSTVIGPPRVRLISLATEVAIRAYAGQQDTSALDELSRSLDAAGLMQTMVRQKYDGRTMRASTSELSLKASDRLAQFASQPLLFIGIGHGGLAASMQTALWLTYRHGADVRYHPLRHSRSEEKQYRDTGLHLPDAAELNYLLEIAKGRTIVVHDEDADDGETVRKSVEHLRRLLPGARVIGIVNDDTRSHEKRRTQGKFWEN